MSRYRYYSDCPVCNDEENFYWVHSEDNGDLYISDDCSLECDKCHTKVYVLNCLFKCGINNHNEYIRPDIYGLIESFSSPSNIHGLTGPARRKMRDTVKTTPGIGKGIFNIKSK